VIIRYPMTSTETPNNHGKERQSLFTAGIWQTSSNLISGLLTWLLILVLARDDIGLGASAVGILNTGTAIYACFSLFMIGIRKSASQKFAEHIYDSPLAIQYARNGTFSIFLVAIISGFALIISSFYIGAPLNFLRAYLGDSLHMPICVHAV